MSNSILNISFSETPNNFFNLAKYFFSQSCNSFLSASPLPSPPSHHTNWMLLQILGTWYDSSRGNDTKLTIYEKERKSGERPAASCSPCLNSPPPGSKLNCKCPGLSYLGSHLFFNCFCCSLRVETILTFSPPLPSWNWAEPR